MIEDDRGVARFPPPAITPGQFEEFVAGELLGAAGPEVDDLAVTLHDKVVGVDGAYSFDATVRYRFAGMAFLVVVEAKLHRNPIKRELVQVLHQKVHSVGAHKGVMVATSPYQAGAVEFATAHGIALVTVTEGRFVFTTRTSTTGAPPAFVAHYDGGPGTRGLVLSADDDDHPGCVAEFLLGRPSG
ncbi:MAG: restriction endonuclease [Mycobacteriales bacterium]